MKIQLPFLELYRAPTIIGTPTPAPIHGVLFSEAKPIPAVPEIRQGEALSALRQEAENVAEHHSIMA